MKTGRHRRLWLVLVPAALGAVAATVLLVIYLGRPTGILAIKSTKTPSAEGRKTTFECIATTPKLSWRWKWPFFSYQWADESVAMADMPNSTVEFTQALIERRFLHPEDEKLPIKKCADIDADNFDRRCRATLFLEPISPDSSDGAGQIWRYTLGINQQSGAGDWSGGYFIASFIVASDGTVLYEFRHDSVETVGMCHYRVEKDGLHLLIVDRPGSVVESNGVVRDLGLPRESEFQEYLYKPGDGSMTKLPRTAQRATNDTQ